MNDFDLAVEPERAKASLGFIPDRPYIYEKLTAGEFLRFHAGLYGLDGGLDVVLNASNPSDLLVVMMFALAHYRSVRQLTETPFQFG